MVDLERLQRELDTLATFSEHPPPAVTRVVFGEMDLRARAYLKTLFAEASLVVHEDPVGNTFARWTGTIHHFRRLRPAPTATPFRMRVVSTERSACSAASRRFACCSAPVLPRSDPST
jgi:hypothetical protein